MAASEKLRIQAELEAKRVHKELARIEKEAAKVGKTLSGAFSGSGGGGAAKGTRALGSGLSAATVKANEFSKSLEASNARVVAFGASAGVIMGIERALKAMVSSAVKVEKAMADVNVVMNASTKTLEQFGKGMFTVAKNTAQSFDTVAEAATELARQGLGMEKTLSRTSDALILTRLTGMNAADSVKSLTAAVNSFNKEGVTSAQVINRMAKVDAAFAVSSEDLAKSVSRVGSSAVDAGVSLNQLMAITTAVQQKTARGGAVIGNAFKTIFTRIQRNDVQKTLQDMGVAVTDSNGKMLDAITILQNLSSSFGNLAKAEQAAVGEQVAGVFQINILKAAMSDLVNKNGEYVRALQTANGATNEAYVRNEQLNQTLDALANKTLANLTQAGANIGGATLEPAIRKLLNGVNATIESFAEGGVAEKLGGDLGKGIMAGVGAFISGPGILLAGVAIGKLVANLAKFAKTAFKEFMGLNKAAESRRALQQSITDLLVKEPALIAKVRNSESGLLDLEKQILNTVKLQNSERRRAALIAKSLSRSLGKMGVVTGPKGTTVPGAAGGFVPNFASAGGERAAAAAGGYRAGAIRTMNQPGAGSMMYNSAETVKRFPGMTQSAIMPPQNSPAGAGYKSAFGAAHGFNPYAAEGFIPNFKGKVDINRKTMMSSPPLNQYTIDGGTASKFPIGVLLAFGDKSLKEGPPLPFGAKAASLTGVKSTSVGKSLASEGANVTLTGVRVKSFQHGTSEKKAEKKFSSLVDRELEGGVGNIAQSMMNAFSISGSKPGKMAPLNEAVQGHIFEEGMRMAMDAAQAEPGAAFDFEAGSNPAPALSDIFGSPISRIDAKRRLETARGAKSGIIKKYFNDPMTRPHGLDILNKERNKRLAKTRTAALGFVPNFSPLTNSIGREMSSGVPASAIRVGSSPALRSSGNPNGVGVYNTIHEPGGLNQGIARSRSMGINPKSHGAAGGFVPNFMIDPAAAEKVRIMRMEGKTAKIESNAANKLSLSADKLMMFSIGLSMLGSGAAAGFGASPRAQSGVNAFTGITSSALMGASMFPANPLIGGAVGGVLGTAMHMGDIGTALGFESAEMQAQQMEDIASAVSMSITKMAVAAEKLKKADIMTGAEKVEATTVMLKEFKKVMDETKDSDNVVVKRVREQLTEKVNTSDLVRGGATTMSPKELTDLQNEVNAKAAQMRAIVAIGDTPINDFFTGRDSLAAGRRESGATGFEARSVTASNLAGAMFSPQLIEKMANIDFARADGEGEVEMVTGADELKAIRAQLAVVAEARQKAFDEAMKATDGEEGPIRNVEVSKAVQAVGQEAILELSARLADLMKMAGDKVFSPSIRQGIEATKNTAVFQAGGGAKGAAKNLGTILMSAFGFSGEVGSAGLVNPDLAVNKKEPINIDVATGPKKGDVRAAMTASRLARENLGRRRRFGTPGVSRYMQGLSTPAIEGTDQALGRIKRQGAVDAADRANRNRMLQFEFAGDDLIKQQAGIQKEGIEAKGQQAEDELVVKQRAKLEAEELKLRETSIKDLKNVKANEFKNRIEELKSFEEFVSKSKDLRGKGIQAELDKLTKTENDRETGLTTAEEARVKYLTGLLSKEKAIDDETRHLKDENNKATKNQTDIIDDNTESLVEMRKKMLEFNTVFEDQKIKDDFTKASNRVKGLQDQSNRGFGISGQEMASARTAARRAQIRQDGASAANPGQAFRDAFTYNDIDAVHEFEEGVVSVAQNMQSSFSSAFQSIASGASSAGDAFAGMAQSILDSISQMSFDMASKMMFSSMGFARGGLVKGYQSGGLVTGGSGNKDDVLTKMQGGEFVIRKSAVNKLGVGVLNSINGYAAGGKTKAPGMGKMLAIGAGAAALGGVLRGGGQSAGPKPLPSQDYGFGRSKYGFLGGPDPDARGADRLGGGGGAASVSLNKAFVYYRRDPKTGALISEAARPTEGRFEVSDRLSLLGRLGEDDPQTARMFEKEQRMSKYQDYLATETQRRKDAVDAVKRKKRGNLIQAYASAAMLIGGAKFMSGGTPSGAEGGGIPGTIASPDLIGPRRADNSFANGGGAGGGLARVMGGEYIMSPSAVRTHGVNVMSELNRGNLPGYAAGGLVGNQGGAAGTPAGGIGDTTNNVKININVDKSGGTEATAEATEQKATGQERDDMQETEKNKELGKILQGVVLQEIVKQQRPGGLLQQTGQKTSR